MKKIKIISVTRSFSYKRVRNMGNYESQTVDLFCSQSAECTEKEAEKASEALALFCKKEVVKSLNEFEKNGLLEPLPTQIPVSQEHPKEWAELEKAKANKKDEVKAEPGDGYKQNKEI